jgi:hypothetical protein
LIASALGPSFAMISNSASREIDQPLDGRNRHPDMPVVATVHPTVFPA